jgi:cytochrome P450
MGRTNAVGPDSPFVLDRDFMADPYALYDLLREDRPVTLAAMPPGPPFWLVTRHADVRAALTDPRLAKDATALGKLLARRVGDGYQRSSVGQALHDHMLNSDPPRHTRLRKLVSRAFTARAIAQLRPRMESLAGELTGALAARLAEGGVVDLVEEFAFPLPMTVICEILGVPLGQRAEFSSWSHTLLSTGPLERAMAAAAAMGAYLNELVAEKQERPGSDILSAIVTVEKDANRLSRAEATSMASLLLVAGHETTMNLISNGMLALLRNPEQMALLRADPAMLPAAVDEFLRLDSPVNLATIRFTTEPVTIAETTIPEGELVLLSLGAANRDPAVYERPDELDLGRCAGSGLAFGHGIHYCLGSQLARLEGEVAFRALLEQLPPLTLSARPHELVWHNSILLRGLTRLPVKLAS